MTIDLDTLEAFAKAATPGPWDTKEGPDFSEILANSKNIALVGSQHKDAAFIAAANPAVVLELIAELRKGRAERYWLATRIALDGVSCPIEPNVCAGTCEDHIQCWLEAARDAVEEQKP